jgi:aryl-alcohol dehydrogenase-like predicted oxidoreductase
VPGGEGVEGTGAARDPEHSDEGDLMQYDVLGRSGIVVSRLCLGTMMFGQVGNPDHDDCVRIIQAAFDAGINFLDTADVYSYGESEEIVGKAIAGRRDQVVVATKCHHPMSDEILNRRGSTRSWIVQACEDSLRRLGTDYIDLYQVHRPDPLTDIDDTLGALSDLVHQGKVRMIGCCTFPPSEIVEAQACAQQRGHLRFRTNQPPYSIFVRGIEREALDVCRRYGMGVLSWSPLNSAWLTGRIRRGQPVPDSPRASLPMNRPRLADEAGFGKPRRPYPSSFDETDPATSRKLDAVEALITVADRAGVSLAQLAVGFVLAHPALTSAIIGPRTMDQLTGQLPAGDLRLGGDVLDAIDAIVPPGTDIVQGEAGYLPPSFTEIAARRRWA